MPNAEHDTVQERDRIEAAFAHAAFAGLKRQAAPSMIVTTAPFRVVWANAPAAALFGAADCRDLGERIGRSGGGTVHRLTELARRLDPGSSPRLDRLRSVQSLSHRIVTVLCQRADMPGLAGGLAIAAVGLGQAPGPEARVIWRAPVNGSDLEASEDPAAAPDPETASAPVAGHDLPAVRSTLRTALDGADQARFVWRTDAVGVLVEADPVLFEALSAPVHPAIGSPFADQVRGFDPDGADRLEEALASSATWGALTIVWPVAGGRAALPITLAASPVFRAGRDFAGFRGFGTPDLDGIEGRAAVPMPQAGPLEQVPRADPPPEASPAEDLPASGPPASGPPVPEIGLFAPLANVVRLWPFGRATSPAVEDPSGTELARPDEPATADLAGEIEAPALQPAGEALEPLVDFESGAGLTSSEHEAFVEIGRTLGGQAASVLPDRVEHTVDPVADMDAAHAAAADAVATGAGSADPGVAEAAAVEASPAAAPSHAEPRPDGAEVPAPSLEDDFIRNAAVLVEATTAGLLVMRGRMLLFANQALLDLLRFPTHAEFELAVGGALANGTQSDASEGAGAIVLPMQDGGEMRFHLETRPIRWNGTAAELRTLRPAADPAPAPAAEIGGSAPRAMLDAAQDAMALIDGTGGVLMLNRQGERWFGQDRKRLAGESFALLLAPESRAAAAAMFDEVRSTSAEARGEVTARLPDRPTLSLDMRLNRLGPDRFSVVWSDLTVLRRYEREFARAKTEAERASDRQPELLAKLSHQIRTPLNAIIGFAEVMVDERFGPLGNPRYKDYLRDIHTSGTHVMSLVNDLLDLSRIEAGRHELDLEAVDINRIISDCVTEMQPQAHRQRVIVRTSFSPRQPMVLADDRAARQIIGNLLSNAVKFNEPGGQVIVSTTAGETGVVTVRIRDTGIGMSDKDVAAALEPFRQLAPAKNATGTGLGLPLTKALVGANGASLSIRSRPGEGTMVEVTFQPSAASAARVPA